MYEFDWGNPPILTHIDNRTKKEKIESDINMIIEPHNFLPIKEWLEIWIQLFYHIISTKKS